MRILHIIVSLEVGGAEKALQRLALAQKSSGDDPIIVALTGGILLQSLRREGLDVRVLGSGRWSYLLAPLRFGKLVRQLRPQVLHAWMWHAMYLSLFAPREIPRVWAVRQSNHALRGRPFLRILLKILASVSPRVNALVYNSKAGLRWYSQLGFSTANASVISNGFNFDVFVPSSERREKFRREWGVPSTSLVVGHVSRFHSDKGIDFLFRAFRDVLTEFPSSKLVMIGKGYSLEHPSFREMAERFGLLDSMVALGPCERVAELLPAMDVFCLSSIRHEGFPNVVGEAMACAIPCVATDLGDTRELISDCGAVVPPSQAEPLAKALKAILAMSAEERQSLGERARQSVLSRFSLERMVGSYRELYGRVISRFEVGSESS